MKSFLESSSDKDSGIKGERTMTKKLAVLFLSALLLMAIPAQAQATQINSTSVSVTLSLSVGESITAAVTPATITFAPNGVASGPITVTTSWNIGTGHSSINTIAWFSSTTAALSGPSNIPTSQTFASINGGTPTACTLPSIGSIVGVGLSGALCPQVFLGAGSAGAGSHSDSVLLSLSGLGSLPAGTWAGAINFESVVI